MKKVFAGGLLFGTTLYFAVLLVGFIYPVDAIPVLVVFVGLMIRSSSIVLHRRAAITSRRIEFKASGRSSET